VLAQLWKSTDLSPVAVLRGHKRGVWSVEFSPVDRVVASASGDQTIRLWSVTDFSCIRTLEGHTSSVLCLKFLRLGTQLVSGSADGLLKLWNIRDSECVNTFKGHEDRIWTLSMAKCKEVIPAEVGSGQPDGHVIIERNMVTGGGDSVISVWRDATEEETEAEREKAEALVLEQQELFNRMAARDYERTVELCIKLEQPGRLQAVLSELLECGPAPSGPVDHVTDALAEYKEMKRAL
jgi:U3 small nucleolar RNA-associated protein 13